jgi:hypothetical protein
MLLLKVFFDLHFLEKSVFLPMLFSKKHIYLLALSTKNLTDNLVKTLR